MQLYFDKISTNQSGEGARDARHTLKQFNPRTFKPMYTSKGGGGGEGFKTSPWVFVWSCIGDQVGHLFGCM